jgi:hypothetical protein
METQEAAVVGTGADAEIPKDQVDLSVEIVNEDQEPTSTFEQVVASSQPTTSSKEIDDSGSNTNRRKRKAPSGVPVSVKSQEEESGSPSKNAIRTVAPEVIEVLDDEDDDDSVEENLETQARMIV